MSRRANIRREGSERWALFLRDHHIIDKRSVHQVLQHFAAAYNNRVDRVWDSNEHSITWRNYFVAAIQKVLSEMPPKDTGTEELERMIKRLQARVKAIAGPSGDDDADQDTAVPASNHVDASTSGENPSTAANPSGAPTDASTGAKPDASSNPTPIAMPRRVININTEVEANISVIEDVLK